MAPTARRPQLAVRSALLVALTLCAALGIGAAPAHAGPIGLQATGGWYTQDNNFFLGAGLRMGFGTITVIPNGEWIFLDSGTSYTLNLDGTLNVLPLGVGSGYVGAGVGLLTVDPKNGSSNTDTAVNLIAGFGLNAIPLKPFAQFKYVVVSGDDPLVFAFGARF
jgi:hypothetical protein